jgi:hypothetical protein
MGTLTALADALRAELEHDAIPVQVGRSALSQLDGCPRVVLLPTTDTFAPARQGLSGVPGEVHLARKSIRAGFAAHLFGADTDATEELRRRVAYTLLAQGGQAVALGGGEWDQGAAVSQDGERYILAFSVEVPLHDAARSETEVTPASTASTFDLVEALPL